MVNEATSRVTLRIVARTAALLYRIRLVFIAIAAGAGAWFGLSLVFDTGGSGRSLLALTVLLWAGVALGVACTLPRVPADVAADDRFGRRMAKRLQLAAYWLGFVVWLGLAAFAAVLTYRAFSIGIGQ